MKNLEQKDGFINRHINGLPNKKCIIKIITNDINGEQEHMCNWIPFDKTKYTQQNIPNNGYLGTAIVIEGIFSGIGFQAWKQNNNEFLWYKKI